MALLFQMNSSLRTLSLGGADIHIDKLRDPGAKEWNLNGQCYQAEDAVIFAALLDANQSVTCVDLSGTRIGDEGAKVLAQVLQVLQISLS